jgi:hypothetical protein
MMTVQTNRTQTKRKAMLKVKGYWRCKSSTEGKDCEHSFDSTLSTARSNFVYTSSDLVPSAQAWFQPWAGQGPLIQARLKAIG